MITLKKASLLQEEIEQLQQYRFYTRHEIDDKEAIRMIDLIDEKNLKPFMESVKDKLHAPSVTVAASLFSKRYSYLLLVPALYAFSRYNKFLNVSIENVEIMDCYENGIWLPKLILRDDAVQVASSEEERTKARSIFFKQLFSEHLNVMLNALASVGNLSKQTLWENAAVYIFWLYEKALYDLDCDHANEDYCFLLSEEDGSIFGTGQKNPLSRFNNEKTLVESEAIRVRTTCCLSYLVSEKQMCKICPKRS